MFSDSMKKCEASAIFFRLPMVASRQRQRGQMSFRNDRNSVIHVRFDLNQHQDSQKHVDAARVVESSSNPGRSEHLPRTQ